MYHFLSSQRKVSILCCCSEWFRKDKGCFLGKYNSCERDNPSLFSPPTLVPGKRRRVPPQLFRKMSLFKRCCLCKMTFWGYPEPAAVQAPLCFRRCKKVCPWEDGAIQLETLHEISRGLLVVYRRSISIIISNWFALPLEKRLRWPTFGRAKNRFSKDCARFRSWFSEARYPL